MEDKKKRTDLNGVNFFMDDIDITLKEGNTRGLVVSNEEFMRMMGISVRTARR